MSMTPIQSVRAVNVIGCRGVPGQHGGFETFAEHLALYLVGAGWDVTVYCQGAESSTKGYSSRAVDYWNGIRRVTFTPQLDGTLGTIEFDLYSILDVVRSKGIDLVLGYNTALLSIIQLIAGRTIIFNMDGVEWKRAKWSAIARAWFWVNEWIAAKIATYTIADNPGITAHLAGRGVKASVMIPYGGTEFASPDPAILERYALAPREYFLVIARAEPENSILEIIEAYNTAKVRKKLVVLGRLDDDNRYHQKLRASASEGVHFVGAIYDVTMVQCLRYYAALYVHGHQVGGTNPSLVEALAAGNAVVAHDNQYNRWTAGTAQAYFKSVTDLHAFLRRADDDSRLLQDMRSAALLRFKGAFEWRIVLAQYDEFLTSALRKGDE